MKNALLKDYLREITKSFERFLSIFLIVAVGVAFFTGIRAVAPDMKNTADIYYDDQNLMDLRVVSTFGITEDDIEEMKKIPGVEAVTGAYFIDAVATLGTIEKVFRIHSLPKDISDTNPGFMNRPLLVEGRYPEAPGECIIEHVDFLGSGLELGSTFKVSSGKATSITDEEYGALKIDTFTVVGTADSPYYLTLDKESSEVGSGKVDYFMMIDMDDFSYPVFTEALITVEGARELSSYSAAYLRLIERVSASLENLGGERVVIRLDEVKNEAHRRLNEQKQILTEKQTEFNQTMKEAEKSLEEGLIKISEGQATLDAKKEYYENLMNDGQRQILEGEAQLAAAQASYDQGLIEYNKVMAEFGDALARLDQAAGELSDLQRRINTELQRLRQMLIDNPNMDPTARVWFEKLIDFFEESIGPVNEAISTVSSLNALIKGQMASAEKRLSDAANQLAESKRKLQNAQSDLNAQRSVAEAEFKKAERDLEAARKEYEKGKAEYEAGKAQGERELENAREQVLRAEQEIELLGAPTWYVLDRSKLYSYVDFEMTADRMDALSQIFPVFFFLVAALVCYTTMTRMVDEQRSFIGTYRALGYSNVSIAAKYTGYAAIASVLGGSLGAVLGVRIFPEVIFNLWRMMYKMPDIVRTDQLPSMIVSVILVSLVTMLAAYTACRKSLKENAAALMRPKAPKNRKPLMLERISFIWDKLNFSKKVTIRNILIYKKRFYMALVGVIGCSALLVAGFGIDDSVSQIVSKQFREIFNYHLSVRFDPNVSELDKRTVVEELQGNPNVSVVSLCTQMNATAKTAGDELSVTLMIADDMEAFGNFVTLRDRITRREISIPESGAVITEKLAKELGAKVGDTITLNNGDGFIRKVTVADITEQYVFHYVYVSPEYYHEIFNLKTKQNSVLVKFNETSSELENQIGNELMRKENVVASVIFFTDSAEKFDSMTTSLSAIVVVIIGCAGLLAFVVLYNLTNINISERTREIATFKVLGFYNNEVSATVYRENIILTVLGAAIGLVVGILLHGSIMSNIEQSGIMFGNYISPLSFLYSFAMTIMFTMLVNWLMYGKLKNIHMIESLKSIE